MIDRDWRSGESEKERGWKGQESEKQRKWQGQESEKSRDWQGKESEKTRAWQEGESSKNREHQTKEREAGQKWKSGESELDRQWNKWNEEAKRDFQKGQQTRQQEHERGLQGNMLENSNKQLASRQQHDKDLARLNAELRGFQTQGAAYGGNAAAAPTSASGGNSTVNVYTGGNPPGFSPGQMQNGREGLGYGNSKAYAQSWTSKGQTTGDNLADPTPYEPTDPGSGVQPHEFRDTGAARRTNDHAGDQWLNRNLTQALTPGSRGIKPLTPSTTAFTSGGQLNPAVGTLPKGAGAAGGPAGLAVSMAAEEGEKFSQAVGGAAHSLGRGYAAAGRIF